jgi:hypothetical protein
MVQLGDPRLALPSSSLDLESDLPVVVFMFVITTKPTSRANFTYLFYRRMNNSR